jgi:hypothetical protein
MVKQIKNIKTVQESFSDPQPTKSKKEISLAGISILIAIVIIKVWLS